jgi:lycopene cyclase domain-containing protein
MARANYLYVLLFISACAIFVTLLFRLRAENFWKRFLITDVVVLAVYVGWDYWAISRGNWYFDKNQILGIFVLSKLPVEEILFFIIVPLMTVLTHLALKKLTGWGTREP